MRTVTVLLAGLFIACAPDREVSPLQVEETVPAAGGALPADAPIRIRFDTWLDPDLRWGSGVGLRSGDERVGFSAGWDPVDRALVIQPVIDLRVGLAYALTLEAEAVRTLDGRTLEAPLSLEFVAGAPTGARPERGPVDFDADLRLSLDRRCSCHGPAPLDWPELRPESLINVPSRRDPNRMLVEPGAPLRSELVLKLLWGYPGVAVGPMPPDAPLPDDEIRRVVAWVETLPR